MHIRALQREMLPGEPLCAPVATVICESLVSLLRTLHARPAWCDIVSEKIVQQLDTVKDMGTPGNKTDDMEDDDKGRVFFNFYYHNKTMFANRVDPDETAPTGAVSSGSILVCQKCA